MKKRRNKILIFLSMLFVLVMSFVIPSYAWSLDSNGNLESQNILSFENATYNGLGVTFECRDNKIYLNGTATSSGPLWVPINIESGSYVFQTFNDFTYNDGFRLTLRNGYGTIKASCSYSTINAYDVFTTDVVLDILAISVVGGVNYNNVVLTLSLVVGSTPLTSYEPYGQIYYNYDSVEKVSKSTYGAFAYASNISIYYNNEIETILYKSYSNIIDFSFEDFVLIRNNCIIIDDFKLIFTLLGGDSDWTYTIKVDFENLSVKVDNFNYWVLTSDCFFFISSSTSGVSYTKQRGNNELSFDLFDKGFSSGQYINGVLYTRYAPNIALPTGSFGTPNSATLYYNDGYNDGYNGGYDVGFDSGFTDGKEEGYTMGYNDGFREGETQDLATNGFKSLIGSIFNYPINFIRSVFNFEFMGINISSMIFFILSIGIVIFVIRRFKK